VVLLSSVISAIPHLLLSLAAPWGYVRRTSVGRDGHTHACRIDPHGTSPLAPARLRPLHRTHPVLRIIPEHQRGLHTATRRIQAWSSHPINWLRVLQLPLTSCSL